MKTKIQAFVIAGSFVLCAALLGADYVRAGTFRGGSEYSLQASTTVEDNLYVAARSLLLEGGIQKDLIAAGGVVTVQGRVGGDAMLAGGTVTMRGPISGDVRVAGGELFSDGQVGGDFVLAGGTIEVRKGASIEGDAVIFGDRVVLDGVFNRSVTVRARSLEVRGTIKGPLDATIGESFSVQDTARIEQGLTYSARSPGLISQGAFIQGTTTFNKRLQEGGNAATKAMAAIGFLGLIGFVGYLLCAALLAYLFPRFSNAVIARVAANSKRAVGVGFVVAILTPVIIVLLLLSLIGFVAAILVGVGYVAFIILAKLFGAILAGAYLAQWRTKELRVSWKWTLLGAVVMSLIGAVPFVGWFISIIIFFAVAGALSDMIYEHWWRTRRDEKNTPVPTP